MLVAGGAFVIGLSLAAAVKVPASHAISVLVVAWITSGIAIWVNHRRVVLIAIVAFAAAGFSIASIENARVHPTRLKGQLERNLIAIDQSVTIEGTLAALPELAPDRIQLKIEAERINDGQVDRPASGTLQLTVLFKDVTARSTFDFMKLEYGSRVMVSCQLRQPTGFRNPGVVPLQSILDQKDLDATVLLKGPEYIVPLGNARRFRVLGTLYALRARAISALLRHLRQPASGLLVASLLGNHNFLDRRTAESFRAGGTFHLLVISGLHVALIASAMLSITKSALRSRPLQWSLCIAALWAFALMVGGEPAVTRAAAMISIAMLGRLAFRRTSAANSLGLSAILLLVARPIDLYDPGFQLSFLTVLAMSVFTAPLYERLRAIGDWRPTEITPHPPRCSWLVRVVSEAVFWDESRFRRELDESRIRFRLDKTVTARLLRPCAFSWVLRNAFATILTTMGIQLTLLPLMILYFHRISLIAPLSNIVEAALISVLMLEGLIFLSLSHLDHDIVAAIGNAVNLSGDLLVWYSRSVDARPGASFRTPDYGEYSVVIYGAYFGTGIAWVAMLSRWNPLSLSKAAQSRQSSWRKRVGLASISTFSAFMIWLVSLHPTASRIERGRLTLTMLDVGQGDSLMLTFPGGRIMLLDAGGRRIFANGTEGESRMFVEDRPGLAEMAIAPYLWHLGVKRLDFIAASHSDVDHVEGFVDIIPAFGIGTALRTPWTSTSDEPFPTTLQKVEILTLLRGSAMDIDGVRVEVLAPFPEMISPRVSPNDRSLVLKLRYGEIGFLLTGDIEKRTETKLLDAGDILKADVLKVAHHGSRTSTTQAFLAAVNPSIALISAGSPSPFGHPHRDVVARLERKGVRVLQTPKCGAIVISTDGRSITHRTHVKCE